MAHNDCRATAPGYPATATTRKAAIIFIYITAGTTTVLACAGLQRVGKAAILAGTVHTCGCATAAAVKIAVRVQGIIITISTRKRR